MPANPEYPKVGGAWNRENGSISVSLDNGLKITLWPNKFKEEGSKQPDWKVNAPAEHVVQYGLESEYSKQQAAGSEDFGDVVENAPF